MWVIEGSEDAAQMLDDSEREEGEERHFELPAPDGAGTSAGAGISAGAPHAPAVARRARLDRAPAPRHAHIRAPHQAPPRAPHLDRPDHGRGEARQPHGLSHEPAAAAHRERPRRGLPLDHRGAYTHTTRVGELHWKAVAATRNTYTRPTRVLGQVDRARRFVTDSILVQELMGQARAGQELMTPDELKAQEPIRDLLGCELADLVRLPAAAEEGASDSEATSSDDAWLVWLRRVTASGQQARTCAV